MLMMEIKQNRCVAFIHHCHRRHHHHHHHRYSLLIHDSSLMLHHPWFIIYDSTFVIHHSSFMIHHSSFMIHHSWFMIYHQSSPLRVHHLPSSQSLSCILHHSSFIYHRLSYLLSRILMSRIPILKLADAQIPTASSPKQSTATGLTIKMVLPRLLAGWNTAKHRKDVWQHCKQQGLPQKVFHLRGLYITPQQLKVMLVSTFS